ncbi:MULTISPECIES: protein YgfX [unclassified Pseudomonas]|uniref:protein YgfX n=1 Tax=unclassified Pseudomonas TaxID=196821 RepID=UPI0025F4123B|nr:MULTISPECIES: protein YgfX [unclassified Pseudomonas]
MSSRNDRFECRWQPSRGLLAAYVGAQALALISLVLLEIPLWAKSAGAFACLLHGLRNLPRSILLSDDRAYTGLRRDGQGWALWNPHEGWQPVRLSPDSIALPRVVVLRFRPAGGTWFNRYWARSICIPSDAMTPDLHRRLRLRLKFSRRRWAAPE